jgi:hypothetical protein
MITGNKIKTPNRNSQQEKKTRLLLTFFSSSTHSYVETDARPYYSDAEIDARQYFSENMGPNEYCDECCCGNSWQ